MVETILSRSVRVMFSGGVALSIGMLAQPVFAQDTTTAAPVQRVEITGSSIRRVDAETPSPVQVITADELKKSGYTSVAQVLNNITANGQGTLSQGFAGAFATGAQAVSLRGLTSSATLVLIDGHRMAPNALSDDAQRSFVDTSQIPFDSIERIEVLKDGASAVYGSDAMAGVVNVILKKSFVGTTVNAEGGTTTEGGGATGHFSVTHGFGNFDEDGYNAFASLEVRKANQITYGDRQGQPWATTDFSRFKNPDGSTNGFNQTPGVPSDWSPHNAPRTPVLVPATGAWTQANTQFYPGCDWTTWQAGGCAYSNTTAGLVPQTENINLLTSFSKKLNDGWKLDVKASIFDSKVEESGYGAGQRTFPHSYAGQIVGGANTPAGLVGTPIPTITLPATYIGPNGAAIGVPMKVYGVIPDAPDERTHVDSRNYRLVADLSGTIGEWDIDASVGYTKNTIKLDVSGLLYTPALVAALNRTSNPFNIAGGNSAADIAAIFPSGHATENSTLSFVELHGSRSLATLPGGDLAVSVGGSYIYRDLETPPLDASQNGTGAGGGLAWVSGKQSNASVFSELSAPVLKTLEIDAAARFDHFDNGQGNSTTPKLGFKWTPSSMFALRGTLATGFRAPNPAESGNAGQTYGAGNGFDPVLCPGGDSHAAGAVIAYCSYGHVALNQANPALKPEKSRSATLGAILEPVKGWANTFDLYKIEIKDQIIAGAPAADPVRGVSIPLDCRDPAGSGTVVTCQPGQGLNTVGVPLYYAATFINANKTTTSGWELSTSYKFKLADYGTLSPKFDWSHTMSYLVDDGTGVYQLAGTHGPSIIGGDTGNPKDRMQLSLTWEKNALSVTTNTNWTSKYDLTDPTSASGVHTCDDAAGYGGWFSTSVPTQYCNVASFMTTDVVVGYKFNKQLFVHGNMNNVFNRQAPIDVQTYGGAPYPVNPSLHEAGIIGRSYNLGLTYTF